MLNENIAQGKWNEIKGGIQKTWGKITGDELDQAKGNLTQLTGLIQKKYGDSQESIREKLNSFISGVGEKSPDKDRKNASTSSTRNLQQKDNADFSANSSSEEKSEGREEEDLEDKDDDTASFSDRRKSQLSQQDTNANQLNRMDAEGAAQVNPKDRH